MRSAWLASQIGTPLLRIRGAHRSKPSQSWQTGKHICSRACQLLLPSEIKSNCQAPSLVVTTPPSKHKHATSTPLQPGPHMRSNPGSRLHGGSTSDNSTHNRATLGHSAHGRTAHGQTAQGGTAQDGTSYDRSAHDRSAHARSTRILRTYARCMDPCSPAGLMRPTLTLAGLTCARPTLAELRCVRT